MTMEYLVCSAYGWACGPTVTDAVIAMQKFTDIDDERLAKIDYNVYYVDAGDELRITDDGFVFNEAVSGP